VVRKGALGLQTFQAKGLGAEALGINNTPTTVSGAGGFGVLIDPGTAARSGDHDNTVTSI
jgi:hypothetical protein